MDGALPCLLISNDRELFVKLAKQNHRPAKAPIPQINPAPLNRTGAFFFAGRLEELPPSFADYTSPHRHSYYAVFYFQSGNGSHTIDFEEYSIAPGTIFFLKPGQVHSWQLDSQFTGFALKISREFCATVSPSPLLGADFPFFSNGKTLVKISATEGATQLADDFERLAQEYQNGKDPKFLFALSQVLLYGIAEAYGRQLRQTPAINGPYNTLLELMDEHIVRERSVTFYAHKLQLPAARLNKICRIESGMSAGAIIRGRLLLEARRLLIHSNLNVQQIARELHFHDAAYFSRFVKKNCGMSPEALRTGARKVP
jgi:AraC family transcriptional regulator, transcriptional activator of pobA